MHHGWTQAAFLQQVYLVWIRAAVAAPSGFSNMTVFNKSRFSNVAFLQPWLHAMCSYLNSSELFSIITHRSTPSLLCLSYRQHSYHCASGPAGNLDCDGGSRCLYLQTEAKVSKRKKKIRSIYLFIIPYFILLDQQKMIRYPTLHNSD